MVVHLQADVDAAIKKLQELKLELAEHQKVCREQPGRYMRQLQSANFAKLHSDPSIVDISSWTGYGLEGAQSCYDVACWQCCLHACVLDMHAALFALQAFEQATGKSSSQNKEAFRAALVRDRRHSTQHMQMFREF